MKDIEEIFHGNLLMVKKMITIEDWMKDLDEVPTNVGKFYNDKASPFHECNEIVLELKKALNSSNTLVLHLGNLEEFQATEKIVKTYSGSKIFRVNPNVIDVLAKENLSSFAEIYAIIDKTATQIINANIMVDFSITEDESVLKASIKKYIKQFIGAPDSSYCGSSDWYYDINSKPFRSNFKPGLAIDTGGAMVGLLLLIIAFSPIKNYTIRIGSMNEDVQMIVENCITYVLDPQ